MRGFLSEDDCRKYNKQFLYQQQILFSSVNVPMCSQPLHYILTANQDNKSIKLKKPGTHIEMHDFCTMEHMQDIIQEKAKIECTIKTCFTEEYYQRDFL